MTFYRECFRIYIRIENHKQDKNVLEVKVLKKAKRIWALALALVMLVNVQMVPSYATEVIQPSADIETEQTEGISTTVESEQTGEVSNTADGTEETGQVQEEFQTSDSILEYVYVESQEVTVSGTQNILISTDTDMSQAENVKLRINSNEKEEIIQADQQIENLLLFTKTYEPGQAGSYELLNVTYTLNGINYVMNITEEITYSVIEEPMITAEALTADVVVTTEDAVTNEEIEAAIGNAEQIVDEVEKLDIPEETKAEIIVGQISKSMNVRTLLTNSGSGNIVIVLDPGHGGSDPGAIYGSLQEKNLNLKIANYVKEELEKYSGVTVYLTRSNDTYVTLSDRVTYSKNVGATSFISIHVNAAGSGQTSANGAEVYVSAHSSYNSNSTALSNKILAELAKVGLSNRGVKINNDDHNNGKYGDGNWQDDLAVIRGNILNGIPAILVEHAFINNPSDYNLLSSEAKLKEMGVADATAIAQYYGLGKNTYTEAQKEQIRQFIRRLYNTCLGREADAEGLNYWLNYVITNNYSGPELARNFIFSPEMFSKRLSNEDYVETLYVALMGRTSDSEGKEYWTNIINSSGDKTAAFNSFASKAEFKSICLNYGMGTYINTDRKIIDTVRVGDFVTRFYQMTMDRQPDEEGLNYWTKQVVNTQSSAVMVRGFMLSTEFMNKNLSKEGFVAVLYRAFMGREGEAEGTAYWVNHLGGNTWNEKKAVIQGFMKSEEYKNLCNQAGITPGTLE